jgi:hypothetical protein
MSGCSREKTFGFVDRDEKSGIEFKALLRPARQNKSAMNCPAGSHSGEEKKVSIL